MDDSFMLLSLTGSSCVDGVPFFSESLSMVVIRPVDPSGEERAGKKMIVAGDQVYNSGARRFEAIGEGEAEQ